jgi:hypothetical protein
MTFLIKRHKWFVALVVDRLPRNSWQAVDAYRQGDQIGRIFAYWVIVFFRQLLKITEVVKIFGFISFQGKSYVLIMTKKGLGHILGEFFTNSSGHPAFRRFSMIVCCKQICIVWKYIIS